MSKRWICAVMVLSLVLLSAGPSIAGDGWGTDYRAAVKQAKADGKYLLLDFSGSDWCGWCIKLDKEVFSEDAFKTYAADNLVTVLLDFPHKKKQADAVKEQNERLMQKYGIRGFPTVLVLDAEENLVARTGYQRGGPEKYVEHLQALIDDYEKKQDGEE